jgi:hypothetical protein
MKKMTLGVIFGIVISSLLAFDDTAYEPTKATSEVEQMQGLYIFTDSKPVLEYEYLGTVKTTFAVDVQYVGTRDKMIRKAKKKFPEAEGIIIQFKSGGTDKGDVIKFKPSRK